jgi:hypothetical protein
MTLTFVCFFEGMYKGSPWLFAKEIEGAQVHTRHTPHSTTP